MEPRLGLFLSLFFFKARFQAAAIKGSSCQTFSPIAVAFVRSPSRGISIMLSRLALSLSPSGGCLSPSTVRGLYTACTRHESRAARRAAPLATTFRHSFVCTRVQRRRRMPLLFGTCVPGKGTACFFPPCSLMLRQHICAEPC